MGQHDRARRAELAVVAVAALVQVACFDDGGRPSRLVDGSPAQPPQVSLEGVASPQVETKAAAIDPHSAAAASIARCRAGAPGHTPRAPVVSRVGVDGASLTFRTASGSDVVACDGTAVHAGPNRPWCGVALGRIRDGRLLDPRLDLAACSTPSGDRLALAWVDPGVLSRYVAVDRDGFVEVYRVVAGLPVRIATTSEIDLDTSSASFHVSEHDAEGRVLRSYKLQARVAG